MKWLPIAAIRFYQRYLRILHNRECIYNPSCSEYMVISIQKYGVLRGVQYGAMRIRRCNGALYQGGEDWP